MRPAHICVHLRHLWKIKEFPSPEIFYPIPRSLLHQEPSPDPVGHRQA